MELRRVRLDSIHSDPANPRLHPPENLEAIRGSLRQFGQVENIVIHKQTGKIIGGNGRYEVMKSEGWQEADVYEFDGTDAQAMALGIALNRSAENAIWDVATLDKLFTSIKESEPGLEKSTGFTGDQIKNLLAKMEGQMQANQTAEELWQGMPEFVQNNVQDFRVIVHFETEEDRDKFAQLVGQTITPQTKYIFYPAQKRMGRPLCVES